MKESVIQKLKTLADSAKYDVSCASSGHTRKNQPGTVGSAAGWGICHSFTADGRCVSLLKIMQTNYCMYDCAYCINRRSNDIPRATLTPEELIELTIEFYRRNYIEGLFLSSGIVVSPDHTMERMIRVARELRTTHRFNGYIHMKSIPGASRELVAQAGLYADRMSVNIEIPREESLRFLAPDKDYASIYKPMSYIQQGLLENAEDRRRLRSAPRFVPAGQSTQMIVGATPESDRDILTLSSALYKVQGMKRVYYSGYIPVNSYDSRLPALKQAPLVRENRLYQSDWLMRFYGFDAAEIVDDAHPNLDLELDPKLGWALRHPEYFPVDLNRADYMQILRTPGIGVKSAQLIVATRRHSRINASTLKKIGVVMKKAQYFVTCGELAHAQTVNELHPDFVRRQLTEKKKKRSDEGQLSLFFDAPSPAVLATAPVSAGIDIQPVTPFPAGRPVTLIPAGQSITSSSAPQSVALSPADQPVTAFGADQKGVHFPADHPIALIPAGQSITFSPAPQSVALSPAGQSVALPLASQAVAYSPAGRLAADFRSVPAAKAPATPLLLTSGNRQNNDGVLLR